jgi:thymidylate synthase
MTNEQRLAGVIIGLDEARIAGDFVTDKTGVRMVELIAPRIELNPRQPLLEFGDVRKTPVKYCAAELEWYLSQDLSTEFIGKKAKIWRDVSCNNGFVNSNYGYLIFSDENGRQYDHALQELIDHPESRRAAMVYNRPSIWTEYNADGRSDWICTFATQHMIRNGELVSVVNMRSNDLIYGLFNDFFWQAWVHDRLHADLKKHYPNLEPGRIVWVANSLHVYERHFDMLAGMADWCREDLSQWLDDSDLPF